MSRIKTTALLGFTAFCLMAPPAYAQTTAPATVAVETTAAAHPVSPEKKALIKELLDLTGSKNIGKLFAEQVSQNIHKIMQQNNATVSEDTLNVVDEEVKGMFDDEMKSGSFYALLYPIYDKYYTADDLKNLIAFYKTPIGKKAIQVMPEITKESMIAGQEWGQSMGPKLQERLKSRMEAENAEKPAAESNAKK